ncbi:MAG: pyrimidine-nucleoside phosphorylase [Acutalibacteraceae bacterium]
MRIYDIISHKRDGLELTKEEIEFFIDGYLNGDIKDYQASALLMAIYLNGMTDDETFCLTEKMAKSGDMLDLSEVGGVTADKHSTGGVGDKTTLIVAPVVASLGIKVAKMSGRGLGHTGGTVDKLEAIKGFNVSLSPEDFIKQVKEIGISVVGQSGNLAPADKKIYALRDATATVGSIALIASSIMSKKLAAGSDCIVLDVKAGSGAFMKTEEEAEILCEKMVSIGKQAGRKISALITDMDTPLGTHIGNTLEIEEAVKVLKGEIKNDLYKVSAELAANMVMLAMNVSYETSKKSVEKALEDQSAYKKFLEFVKAQGGDISMIEDTDKLPKARFERCVVSKKTGYINHTDTEKIGICSVILGAGRVNKEDKIDYTAGIILCKKTGDYVKSGDIIARLFTNNEKTMEQAEKLFISAIDFSQEKPKEKPLIYKTIL